jgi:(p)ppGpp synthase/HD superfamily hydrolase
VNDQAREKEGTLGEDRESFFKRFILKITPTELERLNTAYDMAKYGHQNQVRESGARYFEHVRATAIILIDELDITDVEMVIAALLHDMLEDSFLLTAERIRINFGERVAGFVSLMTKPKKNDKRFASDHERHLWYFNQLKAATPEVKLLKLADRLQNMRTLGSCSLEKRARKIKETEDIYIPFIADIDQKYPDKAKYLSIQIKTTLSNY